MTKNICIEIKTDIGGQASSEIVLLNNSLCAIM